MYLVLLCVFLFAAELFGLCIRWFCRLFGLIMVFGFGFNAAIV